MKDVSQTEQNTLKKPYTGMIINPTFSTILHNAEACIKNKQENSFPLIARLWSDYLGHSISEKDVAILMALLKIARIKLNIDAQDSYVDACAYVALAGSNLSNS